MNNNPLHQSLVAQALTNNQIAQQQAMSAPMQNLLSAGGYLNASSPPASNLGNVLAGMISIMTAFTQKTASHKSSHYKLHADAQTKWWRHWYSILQKPVQVRIDAVESVADVQQVYDDAAQEWQKLASEHKSYIAPVGYDLEAHQWVLAFRNKQEALLFKLANGGAV